MFAVACLSLIREFGGGLVISSLGVMAPIMSARTGIDVFKVSSLTAFGQHSDETGIKMLICKTSTAISIMGYQIEGSQLMGPHK